MAEIRNMYPDIFNDSRDLSIDYLVENDIKYGPVIIDTLTFTFKKFRDAEIVSFLAQFGFNMVLQVDVDGEPITHNGFARVYIDEKTKLRLSCEWLSCGRNEYSMLNVPGSTCGFLNSQGKMFSFCSSLSALCTFSEIGKEIKCTRIDLAKDCFTDLFVKHFAEIPEIKRSCLFYSQSCEYQPFASYKSGKLVNGWTFYFGKRSCPFFVRMYDKKVEQKVTDERLPYWTRLEFEIKASKSANESVKCFKRFVSGENLNKIFSDYACKRFFLLTKPYIGERPHLDDVAILPAFKKFLDFEMADESAKLVFCEELFVLSHTKKDKWRKNMVKSIAPPLFEGLTNAQIGVRLSNLVYNEYEYKFDKENGGIWVYLSSRSGKIENDIPFFKVDCPSEAYDLIAEASIDNDLTVEQVLELIKQCNNEILSSKIIYNL